MPRKPRPTAPSSTNNANKCHSLKSQSGRPASAGTRTKTVSATRNLQPSHKTTPTSRPETRRPNSAPMKSNSNPPAQKTASRTIHSQPRKTAIPNMTNASKTNPQFQPQNTPKRPPTRAQVVQRELSEKVKQISVPKDDKKKSVQNVLNVIQPVATKLRKSGEYQGTIRKSGSYATNTKIKSADEFDYDVPMALKGCSIRKSGKIHYDLKNEHPSLNVPAQIVKTSTGTKIPNGYVEVRTDSDEPLVPRKVKEDLHKHLKDVASKKQSMHLSKYAHGPAVTSTLKKKGFHDISIDFSASIPTNDVTVKDYQWPRKDTKKVLNKDIIQKISDQDMILVPKDNKFWYVSPAMQEKALLNNMDAKDNGCRKECHKLLKNDFQKLKNKSPNAFPGVSTIVFKHQLFWMNEKKPGQDWSKENLHKCYPDMLEDVSTTLRSGQLPNYFKTSENILGGKDQEELNRLANCIGRTRHDILNRK